MVMRHTSSHEVRSTRSVLALGLALAAIALAACSSASSSVRSRGSLEPLPEGEEGVAVLCAKILTVDGEDHVFTPGMILVHDAKIVYVGARAPVPSGYRELDLGSSWATPGMVELHSHIHTGGWGDINDMVIPVNPELRPRPDSPVELARQGGGAAASRRSSDPRQRHEQQRLRRDLQVEGERDVRGSPRPRSGRHEGRPVLQPRAAGRRSRAHPRGSLVHPRGRERSRHRREPRAPVRPGAREPQAVHTGELPS